MYSVISPKYRPKKTKKDKKRPLKLVTRAKICANDFPFSFRFKTAPELLKLFGLDGK